MCILVIVLAPVFRKVDSAIHWIAQLDVVILILWIAIYPVDSAIQLSNNRGLAYIIYTVSYLLKNPAKLLCSQDSEILPFKMLSLFIHILERQEREQREREEAMEAEDLAEEAEEAERAAAEVARLAAEEAKKATDEAARKAAEEAEKKALAEAMANKEKRLRANLKGATKSRKVERIEGAVKEAKSAKMPGN